VRDLKVAGVNGVDEVTVFASTSGYVFHWTPDEDDHEANDEEWRLRFASKLVPGDQIVAPDGATLAYTHNQAMPSTTWTVDHNLGVLLPAVVLQDEFGVEFQTDVDYVSTSRLLVILASPAAGVAYIVA
jgi:hypothetical protein